MTAWPPRVALPPSTALETAACRWQDSDFHDPRAQLRAVRELLGSDPALRARLSVVERSLRDRHAAIVEQIPTDDASLALIAATFGVVTADGNGHGAGQLVWPIRPDAAPEFRLASLPLHTDSAFSDHPHPLMGLACVEPSADYDGRSLLLRATDIVDALTAAERGRELRLLYDGCYPFVTEREDVTPVRFGPVLRETQDGTVVSFLARTIRAGLAAAPRALDHEHLAALDVFEDELANSRHQTSTFLRTGELLLWDNRHVLHGRSGIGPGGANRLLKRVKLARLHSPGILSGRPGSAHEGTTP